MIPFAHAASSVRVIFGSGTVGERIAADVETLKLGINSQSMNVVLLIVAKSRKSVATYETFLGIRDGS